MSLFCHKLALCHFTVWASVFPVIEEGNLDKIPSFKGLPIISAINIFHFYFQSILILVGVLQCPMLALTRNCVLRKLGTQF